MSYLDAVPAYVYTLPCGHDFRSLTRSAPGDDGRHWFYCRTCREYAGIPNVLMAGVELRPLKPSGRLSYGEGEIAKQVDAAITCDRIAAHYRAVWDAQTEAEVATTLGVSRRLVWRVALDLGVYESRTTDHRC